MERVSKLIVVAWTLAALSFQVWLLRSWVALPVAAALIFGASFALAAWNGRTIAIVLTFTYVSPALIWLVHGSYHAYSSVLWMAALIGSLLPRMTRTGWHIPGRWRAPLVCWALVVVSGATIVVARELDFTPSLLTVTNVANSIGGGWPAFVVQWTLHVALTLVVGLLWFDWLFESRLEFQTVVLRPLALGCLAMTFVSTYQLFVDVTFLNPTVYGGLGRASGTLFDANVAGTVAAMWMGGMVLLADRVAIRFRMFALVVGLGFTGLAVWASASRTALAAAAITAPFLIAAWRRAAGRGQPIIPGRRAAGVLVVTAAVALLVVVGSAGSRAGATGPLPRIRAMLSDQSVGSVRRFVGELWNRNGYGSTSTQIIREFPWVGIGVGSFHILVPDFSRQFGGFGMPRDNAQNWYRHQLVEFGIVGSLAWIAWVVLFSTFLFQRRPASPPGSLVLRGVLVAFAVISLVGMPAQDLTTSITFWTMTFWFISLAGTSAPAPLSKSAVAAVSASVLAYVVGTIIVATTELRVPVRAQRFGWPYAHGVYEPEVDALGRRQQWTKRRAVIVLEAPTAWIALTLSIDHLSMLRGAVRPQTAPTRPVDVSVRQDGVQVFARRVTTTAPVTEYLRVREGQRWVLLETSVSRTFKPMEFGVADERELGVLLKWDFVDDPMLSKRADFSLDRRRTPIDNWTFIW